MWKILKRKERKQLVGLVHMWSDLNQYPHAVILAWCMLITTIFVALWDSFIFGENGTFFWPYRLAGLGVSAVNLIVLKLLKRRLTGKTHPVTAFCLLVPGLFYNSISHSFLSTAHFTREIIFIGNLLSVGLTVVFLNRFWLLQYSAQLVSLLGIGAVVYFDPAAGPYGATLALSHVLIFFACGVLRRQFAQTLYDRYHSLLTIMPARMAQLMMLRNERDLEKIFAPRTMHSICVISDWRNFQALISEQDPETIAKLFETYYGLVLDALDKQVPTGKYYCSWTADELFIVFFDEEHAIQENFAQATRFILYFLTELNDIVRKTVGFDLRYDLGVACGPGLIGLQGPSRMKRTTVVSKVAGTAKRLEAEAKLHRASLGDVNHYPIMAMDAHMSAYLLQRGLIRAVDLQEAQATTKDIADLHIHLWQKNSRIMETSLFEELIKTKRDAA